MVVWHSGYLAGPNTWFNVSITPLLCLWACAWWWVTEQVKSLLPEKRVPLSAAITTFLDLMWSACALLGGSLVEERTATLAILNKTLNKGHNVVSLKCFPSNRWAWPEARNLHFYSLLWPQNSNHTVLWEQPRVIARDLFLVWPRKSPPPSEAMHNC